MDIDSTLGHKDFFNMHTTNIFHIKFVMRIIERKQMAISYPFQVVEFFGELLYHVLKNDIRWEPKITNGTESNRQTIILIR